jgi:hypothetical protein
MLSKRWIKLIILLFLGMLIPLVWDSFVFDVIEGNVAGGSDKGGVGLKAAIAKAAEQATKAKAAAEASAKSAAAKEAADEKKELDELAAATKELTDATKAANAAEADFKKSAAELGIKESFVEGVTSKSKSKTPTAADLKNLELKKTKAKNLKTGLDNIKKKIDSAAKKIAERATKKAAKSKK